MSADANRKGRGGKQITLLRRSSLLSKDFQQFAYAVSHDMNAPLNAMSNFSGLFMRKYDHLLDDDGRRYLSFIVDGRNKIQAMMEGLLQYSRINTEPFTPVTLETGKIVEECLNARQETIQQIQQVVTGPLPDITRDRT